MRKKLKEKDDDPRKWVKNIKNLKQKNLTKSFILKENLFFRTKFVSNG